MRFRSIVVFTLSVCSFVSPVLCKQTQSAAVDTAKPVVPAAPASATASTSTEKLMLKDGSDVYLKFAQYISSKTAAEGDSVNLVLDQDLKIGDVLVAKAGAKAVGTVTHVKKAGMMGKPGELNMRLEYLLINDERVKIRGNKGKEGEGKEGTAVALTVLFGPLGLIKHGKDVDVKEGTPLPAYLDQDYVVSTYK